MVAPTPAGFSRFQLVLRDFQIRVWVDKGRGGVYRDGEKITVFLDMNRDGHLRLYHTDASGEMRLIFPNSFHPEDTAAGGQIQSIPGAGLNFEFKAAPPFRAEDSCVFTTIEK